MTKRIISFLLAMTMLVGIIPGLPMQNRRSSILSSMRKTNLYYGQIPSKRRKVIRLPKAAIKPVVRHRCRTAPTRYLQFL